MRNLILHRTSNSITIYLIAISLFVIMSDSFSQSINKCIIIESTQNNIDGSILSVNPGDTVLIKAGLRERIRIINFHGDSVNNIVFKNYDGDVIVSNDSLSYGISISNCSYIKLTGTGNPNSTYGIKILNTPRGASGLGISNFSTNYEIDHIEIANTGFAGIFAKTDPTPDGLANRGNFTQYNTYIHDNYIHDTYGEGIYLGHAFYTGVQKNVNGEMVILYPHELKGVRVFNNKIENTGWDGIQVGCATEDCEIYNNQITNYGTGDECNQKSGIQIGGGTTGKCYNNLIKRGFGNGISVFGLGNNTIYNNIIVYAGNSDIDNDPTKIAYGIFCDDRSTIPGSSFNFLNNEIIAPKTDGIRIYSSLSKNNKLYNNVILNPGSYGLYYNINKSYVYANPDVDLEITNNCFKTDFETTVNLEDLQEIYQFSYTLPIIDKGIDVSSFGITKDFNNKSRIINNKSDIGAFELEDQLNKIESQKSNFSVFPNPSNGDFVILNSKNTPINKITIRTLNGNTVYEENQVSNITTQVNLSNTLKTGNYIACIQTNNTINTYKIIIQ